jgi:AraC family transcriptional regulator of adaptative response/methylated-DNA-[protein]-cysteine methyltransferase
MADYASDAACWQAVVSRDRGADGVFYYSVATTGVYCRPSCAARLARRENVRFHRTTAAAEEAGFRPCKRCRPQGPGPEAEHAAAVAKACRLIDEAEEMPNLTDLAAAAGLSRFHFHRVFKAMTGITPKAYAAHRRAGRVREELGRGGTVTEAIYGAGFNSNGRFYATATEMLGMTPKSFRAGGPGASIRFAVGQSSLGAILVAATEKGVAAIILGDDPATLVDELQAMFPKAELVGADQAFETMVAKVVGYVEAPALGLDLPLDVRGTAFQQRVWQALCEIPAGTTATYTEIARRVGRPKAIRAVGQACAANNLALAIPCHRVVRTDGSLSGYRWGIERKRDLLQREGAR